MSLNGFLAIRYFLLHIAKFTINFLKIILLTFSQISRYLSKNVASFITNLKSSVTSKSILYALTFEKNMHKSVFVANEIYEVLFTERSLLDTTTSKLI